jgi:hypothetical protein
MHNEEDRMPAATDRQVFMEALQLWDRPMEELTHNQVFERNLNVEKVVEDLFDHWFDSDGSVCIGTA